jgi:hypothetical protein
MLYAIWFIAAEVVTEFNHYEVYGPLLLFTTLIYYHYYRICLFALSACIVSHNAIHRCQDRANQLYKKLEDLGVIRSSETPVVHHVPGPTSHNRDPVSVDEL